MNIADRKARIEKWAKIGLISAIGLLVSPIIFLTIKGLIGLAIAAVIGLTMVTFAPWVSMKFANWKVKAIVHEAGENPIETLTNLLIAKRQAFLTFQQNVVAAVTARDNFRDKVTAFSKKYPARAVEFQKKLENMTKLVELKKRALADAEQALEDGEHKLDEMKAYWEMSQAAQEAHAAAGMDTGDLYEKLKADTAVDAVYSSMNKAFAQLEVAASLEENNPAPALEMQEADILEVPFKQTTKVA